MINGIYFRDYVRSMRCNGCCFCSCCCRTQWIRSLATHHSRFMCVVSSLFYLHRLHNWPNAIQTVSVVSPLAFGIAFFIAMRVRWKCLFDVSGSLHASTAAGETFCLFPAFLACVRVRVCEVCMWVFRFDFILYTFTWMATTCSCRCVVRNMFVPKPNGTMYRWKICPEYASEC